MSGRITLTGIKSFGYHGVLDSERKNGQVFLVDVAMEVNLVNLGDKLENTIDYSKITEIVIKEIDSNPVNLIETLAERIADKILSFDEKIRIVTITVHKPSAPVSAEIADVSVSISKAR